MDLWTHVNLVLSSSLWTDCFANTSVCLLDVDSGLSISLIQRRRLFAGFAAARRTCRTGVRRTCVERHIGLHIIITLFLFFFLFFLTYVII